jgi:two-component system sensor histidine kinase CpxA
MFKRLYVKLYLYIFLSVVSSIFITSLYFYFKINYYQSNELSGNSLKISWLIRDEILSIENFDGKEISNRIKNLNRHLEWYIAYIRNNQIVASSNIGKNNLNDYDLNKIDLNKEFIVLSENSKYIDILFLLHKNDKQKRLLFISAKRRLPNSFISFEQILLMTILIGFLLIPFSLYVLSPYKKLISLVNSISEGDFNKKLDVHNNNEFKELFEAFNNMSFRINEMIKHKQRLIADVSHELKSPLTRMRMSQEIILNENIKNKNKYIYETIEEIENLNKTITSLLILSKFELDKRELKIERINIKNFVLDMLNKNNLLFEKHKIKFNLKLLDGIFCNIDIVLFESAFNNIFSNLIRYSPFDSYVDITMNRYKDKEFDIQIRDRGMGIRESELERIFEPFYRTDESRNSETGGTGLGLAILNKIINSHNGKVFAILPEDTDSGLIIKILLKES